MRTILALSAIVCCVYGATLPPQIVWSRCSADPANTIMTIDSFNLHPTPITFPGDVHVSLNLTVNKPITELYIDVELNKTTDFGIDIPIPCIQNIGTCQKIAACGILDDLKNGTTEAQNLGVQLDAILLSALGHNAQCPVQPETVSVTDELVKLDAVPSVLSVIASGNYNIRISLYDSKTATANVGCIQFSAPIASTSTGFLFG